MMHYDGVLPDEQAFSEHLLTCCFSLEKLLHLERDLFLMGNMPLIELPPEMKQKYNRRKKNKLNYLL